MTHEERLLIGALIALLTWLVVYELVAAYVRRKAGPEDRRHGVRLVPGQSVNLGCRPLLVLGIVFIVLFAWIRDTRRALEAQGQKLDQMEKKLEDVDRKLDSAAGRARPG